MVHLQQSQEYYRSHGILKVPVSLSEEGETLVALLYCQFWTAQCLVLFNSLCQDVTNMAGS